MAKQLNTADTEHWDLIIKPKSGLFDFRLRELHKYRDLLWLWVRREHVGAYKQTLLGPLWHFISPVFTTFTYLLIFGKIAKLDTKLNQRRYNAGKWHNEAGEIHFPKNACIV